MKKNRINLEEKLLMFLPEYNLDEEVFNSIFKTLKDKNFNMGQVRAIFNQVVPIESLDLPTLYWFTKAFYKATEESRINPDIFFTEIEKEKFEEFKIIKNKDIKTRKNSLVLNDVLSLKEDQWTTKLTFKQISDLFNAGWVNYNPETQRNLKTKNVNGNIIRKININKKSVREIKELLLKDLFVSNTITLNIRKTGEEEILYNENNKEMEVFGSIDIIDGFHRSLAILEAIRDNPNLEGSMIISLVNFDINKAQAYIVQEDKRNKINRDQIKYLNQEDLENQIVKSLNEDVKSELRGLVATDTKLIKYYKAVTLFETLSNSIKMNFDIKTQRDVRKISDFLRDFFNELIGIRYEDFENVKNSRKTSIATYSNMFIGYIAMASELYKDENSNWEKKLEENLDKIDFNVDNSLWKELDIFEMRPIKKQYREIINYFKELIRNE